MVYQLKESKNLHGIIAPKNSVFYLDDFGNIFLCKNLPRNYEGKAPRLRIYIYDAEFKTWDNGGIYKNNMARKLWDFYKKRGRKQVTYEENIPRNNPVRKHKHSGGFMRDNAGAITDYACGKLPQWADWR